MQTTKSHNGRLGVPVQKKNGPVFFFPAFIHVSTFWFQQGVPGWHFGCTPPRCFHVSNVSRENLELKVLTLTFFQVFSWFKSQRPKSAGYIGYMDVGSEPPHKAAVIPGAAELSVARVYIRCAPAHSDISVGTHISVGLHLGKLPGATPCYSPHKYVVTRSGVVPGAPVGVLASWDVGAPR